MKTMKKLMALLMTLLALAACDNNGGEPGKEEPIRILGAVGAQLRRIHAQMPNREKVRRSHHIIRTDGTPGIPATVTSSVLLGMTQHYFMQLKNGKEIEVVENGDLTDIIPDGSTVTLEIMPLKVNIFDAETRTTLIREGV